MSEENKCGCACHKGKGLTGILVALIGLTFLLLNTQVIGAEIAGIVWPVLVILLGLKMMSRMCKCCSNPGK
jgi:hypothetical protein